MIALEDMRILWAQFRNLPMQAINASLASKCLQSKCNFYSQHCLFRLEVATIVPPLVLVRVFCSYAVFRWIGRYAHLMSILFL